MLRAATVVHFDSDNPYRGANALGCAALRDVAVGSVRWHTQRKQLLDAVLRVGELRVPLVLERPFDGSAYWARLNESTREAAVEAYFARERLVARKLESEYVPHFYGGCWTSFGVLLHLSEPLRSLQSVIDDELVDWRQRVRIASNAVRALAFLEHFPFGHAAIYGDVWPTHFGVDGELHLKFVDFQSFFAYETRFGVYACHDDAECHEQFWDTEKHPRVLLGLRDLQPPADDFRCVRGKCNGVDSLTQWLAFCKLLLEPLFEPIAADTDVPADVKTPLRNVIDGCLASKRVDRLTPSAALTVFEKLVPRTQKVRTLSMRVVFDDDDDDDKTDDGK